MFDLHLEIWERGREQVEWEFELRKAEILEKCWSIQAYISAKADEKII